MPKVSSSTKFDKSFKKIPATIKLAFYKRLTLFLSSPDHPQPHNHPLRGRLKGRYSFNITGDWRVIYRKINNNHVYFDSIGTHSQLYK